MGVRRRVLLRNTYKPRQSPWRNGPCAFQRHPSLSAPLKQCPIANCAKADLTRDAGLANAAGPAPMGATAE
jgi:hypothetical protein